MTSPTRSWTRTRRPARTFAVRSGLRGGGAAYEGVRHSPWSGSKADASATSGPVVQSVSPQAQVPSPREHIPMRAGTHRTGAPRVHTAKTKHLKLHGRGPNSSGQGNGHAYGRAKHYASDASVSSRHAHVVSN